MRTRAMQRRITAGAALFLLGLAAGAQAATWTPLSLEGAGRTWFAGTTFTDLEPTWSWADPRARHALLPPLFSDTRDRSPQSGDSPTDIVFDAGSNAPMVDLAARTIDLSTLVAAVYTPSRNCEGTAGCIAGIPAGTPLWEVTFSWEFGPVEPVPFVTNANGSFTADWTVPDTNVPGFAPGTAFGLVFAPVPEPGSWILMIAGLAVVAGLLRRRRIAAD